MYLSSILFAAGLLVAETPDTLQTVTVVADRGVVVSRTDTLTVSNSLSITDLLQKSPGLFVNDQGGVAGLKTVSLRGMGSANTVIYVDGVRVGNVQSGQSDPGMLGMENFSGAVIDYAQNSVDFKTSRPNFAEGRTFAGKVSVLGGSFGTWQPALRLDFKLPGRTSLSANLAGISSKGNYPCGDGQTRTNNDIKQLRGGLDGFGKFAYGEWHAKIWANAGDRGTPGSVSWPSEDRQTDRNLFAQGQLKRHFSQLYSLQLSAKASYDKIFYASSWGDSRYVQTEYQLNSAHLFNVLNCLSFTVRADVSYDKLASTNYDASRFSAFGVASASFKSGSFKADAAIEYAGAFDAGGLSRNSVSPSMNLRLGIIDGLDLIAFGRRAYRIPTFNELYYVGYGNPDLRPEDAWLGDIGIDFRRTIGTVWTVSAKIDCFHYSLKDKITSAQNPDNPNQWLPYNIGKVRSTGVDAAAGFAFAANGWTAGLDARYSLQSAVDLTEGSAGYGGQIAYVPKHTAVISADASFKGWSLNANWNLRAGREDSLGEMPDWNTLDAAICKAIRFSEVFGLTLKFTARNIFDCRYELSTGYPVQGRNFMLGFEMNF